MVRKAEEQERKRAEEADERERAEAEWSLAPREDEWNAIAESVLRRDPRKSGKLASVECVRDTFHTDGVEEELAEKGRKSFGSFNPTLEKYRGERREVLQDEAAQDAAVAGAVGDDAFAERMMKIRRKADALRAKVGKRKRSEPGEGKKESKRPKKKARR